MGRYLSLVPTIIYFKINFKFNRVIYEIIIWIHNRLIVRQDFYQSGYRLSDSFQPFEKQFYGPKKAPNSSTMPNIVRRLASSFVVILLALETFYQLRNFAKGSGMEGKIERGNIPHWSMLRLSQFSNWDVTCFIVTKLHLYFFF